MDGGIRQSGSVTPRHASVWATDGILQDGGTSFEGNLTSLGITAAGDTSFAINDATVDQPYHAFSFGVNQTSGALISVDAFGGATPVGLHFRMNGTLSAFSIAADGTVNVGPISFTNLILGASPNNILTVSPGATSTDPVTFTASGLGGYQFTQNPVGMTFHNFPDGTNSGLLVRWTNTSVPGTAAVEVAPINIIASDYPGALSSILGINVSVAANSTQFAATRWPQVVGGSFTASKAGMCYVAGIHTTARETNGNPSSVNDALLGIEVAHGANGDDDGGLASSAGLRLGMHLSQFPQNVIPGWVATTSYSLGDVVNPSLSNSFIYVCTVAGVSGSSQPSWPTSAGSVSDGSVTWTFDGPSAVFAMGYQVDGAVNAVTKSCFGNFGTRTYQVFDARTAVAPGGYSSPVAAVRMDPGQIVDFNGASTSTKAGWIGAAGSYLQFVTSAVHRLRWFSGGAELFSFNDNGTLTISTSTPGTPSIVMGVENPISFTAGDNRVLYYTQSGTARLVYSSGGYGGSELFSMTDTGLMTLAGNLLVTGETGFNGTTPIAKPTVTGSKGANAALASLMTALAAYGLVTDSTT